MSGSATGLKLTASMDDRMSGPMKEIGKEAKKMGEGFSKSAAVLQLVGDSAGKMGAGVADAAGKVSSLAGIMSSGGVFGVAMAAASAAVSGVIYLWGKFHESNEVAREGLKIYASVLASTKAHLDELAKGTAAANDQILAIGRTATEAKVLDLKFQLADITQALGEYIPSAREANARTQALVDSGAVDAKTAGEQYQARTKVVSEKLREIQAIEDQIAAYGQLAAAQKVEADGKKLVEDRAKATEMAYARETEMAKTRLDALHQISEAEKNENARKNEAWLKDQHDAYAAQIAAEKKAEEDRVRMADQAASQIVDAFAGAFEQMANGTETADQAFKSMFVGFGKMALKSAAEYVLAEGIKKVARTSTSAVSTTADALDTASAVGAAATQTTAAVAAGLTKMAVDESTAASSAISAHAGIPFVGIAIGVAAAAAIVAAILGFKKFATGGVVTGGSGPTSDDVPIMASRGETVIPAGLSNHLRHVLNSNGPASAGGSGFAAGGVVHGPPRASGAGLTVVNNFSSWAPANSLEQRRAARSIEQSARIVRQRMGAA